MNYHLKVVSREISGVVKISEDCQFNKIEAEKVIIYENVTARLFGKVKDVVVKKGGRLFLHGIISGQIENKGEIIVFG